MVVCRAVRDERGRARVYGLLVAGGVGEELERLCLIKYERNDISLLAPVSVSPRRTEKRKKVSEEKGLPCVLCLKA